MGTERTTAPKAPAAIPLHRVAVDVADLLSGAIGALREQAEFEGIDIIIAGPHLPPVALDPDKIAWAVTTLVGNALRYVRKATRRSAGGTIRIRMDVTNGALVVAIEDDGPGIPSEKVARLFERRTESRHAAGLSLLMVRDVVVAHGGDVEVKSCCQPMDAGTCVTLRIPLEPASPHPATAGGATAAPEASGAS
jgi:signal transduction histidine kinase